MKGRRQEQWDEQSSASLPKFLARMRNMVSFIHYHTAFRLHASGDNRLSPKVRCSVVMNGVFDSSYYRMILDDKPAVAARFLPHAVMSSLRLSQWPT